MPHSTDGLRVGYVLKRFPRFSETFILNEVLAHEAAGAIVDVFSLLDPPDEPRHASLTRLRARVTMLSGAAAGRDAHPATGDMELFSGKTPRQTGRLMAKAGAVANAARARGITHLHAHFGSDAATVALLAARAMGGTFSFTAHARDIYHTYVSPEADAAMRRAKLRAAAFTVTVSDYNARHLAALCPEAAGRIIRLYNGIDLRAFPPVDLVRQRPGRMLAVGRLVEKKGFASLIDAAAILRDRGLAFDLDIVGSGPLEAELAAQVDRLALSRHVTLAGALPQERLVERIEEATLAVLACKVTKSGDRDGLPTVLLEAMARGLPVVTTTVSGGPEIVLPDITGKLCPPDDPAALAEAIAAVLADGDQARRMGAEGRKRAERLFDLDRNAATLRALLAAPATAPARIGRAA
ncbi:MAG: glycosyltransferase family 4 protein [Albidovulum sp.]|uniref:glycosyltransferase family 4 protein n=1 Tax=Albidovulum sp. TaxID=1872424 RepID=UPI003CA6D6B2